MIDYTTNITVLLLEPGHLEEEYPITGLSLRFRVAVQIQQVGGEHKS